MDRLKIDKDFRDRVLATEKHEASLAPAKEEGCTHKGYEGYEGTEGMVIDSRDLIIPDDDLIA